MLCLPIQDIAVVAINHFEVRMYCLFYAHQTAPRNFKLTAVSSYCVSLSYEAKGGLVYQV